MVEAPRIRGPWVGTVCLGVMSLACRPSSEGARPPSEFPAVVMSTGGKGSPHTPLAENREQPWPGMVAVLVALSIMQLHERGLVHLEDPVGLHLQSWRDRQERWPARIRHLLAHTAGLPARADLEVRWLPAGGESWLIEPLETALGEQGLPRWTPGTTQQESALGTLALAVIIEERTGRRFHQYVQENIFGPLGMKSARVDTEGVWGSVDDLGRLAAALAHDPNAPGVALEEETTRQMFALQLRFDGLPWPRGLHWWHDLWHGGTCVIHQDSKDGHRIYLRICKGRESWVVALGTARARSLARRSDDVLRETITKGP